MTKTVERMLVFLFSTAVVVATTHAETPPNIVVIMADDLGYGDLACYGTKSLETPHIDRLAAEGLKFTNGYCSASTCTPTRYSFMTGIYAFRNKGTGVAAPNNPAIIQPGTETIASLLKKANYKTAVVGKWHLGLGGKNGPEWNGELKPGPLEIGFDQCFLLPTTNDRVPQVYVKDHRVLNLDPSDPLWVGDEAPEGHPTGITHRDTLRMDWTHGHNESIHNGIGRIGFYTGGHAARFRDEDLGDKWVEESATFIEENKSQPFFLFFASHDLHVPRMPHERFQGATTLGSRGDAIVELDWCVGEVTKTLERLGLAENTLVVFCSDNGPVLDDGYKDGAVEQLGSHKPSGPFSGGKYSIQEGGTRTPFITWWPGTIEPGVSDELVCTIDLAASVAALVDVELPTGACPDSENVLPALLGKPDAKGRTQLVQQDNGNSGALGFRQGDWKLQRQPLLKKQQKPGGPKFNYLLFDLNSDPAEKKNVAGKNPEKLREMIDALDAVIEQKR